MNFFLAIVLVPLLTGCGNSKGLRTVSAATAIPGENTISNPEFFPPPPLPSSINTNPTNPNIPAPVNIPLPNSYFEDLLADLPQPPPILPNPIPLISDIHATPPDLHQSNPMTPNNYTSVGAWADCGMGQCNGSQILSILRVLISHPESTTPVVTGVAISQGGLHLDSGGPIPLNFVTFGFLADCEGPYCLGNQVLAMTKRPYNTLAPGAKYLVDLQVLGYGKHASTPIACPTGYETVGYITDCGGGQCSGLETICSRFRNKF